MNDVALWRAIARYSVLLRVMARFGADGCHSLDLPEFFGVPLDRFAIDEKLIAACAFNPHTIQMSLLAKPLHRSLRARNAKLCKQFNGLSDR